MIPRPKATLTVRKVGLHPREGKNLVKDPLLVVLSIKKLKAMIMKRLINLKWITFRTLWKRTIRWIKLITRKINTTLMLTSSRQTIGGIEVGSYGMSIQKVLERKNYSR